MSELDKGTIPIGFKMSIAWSGPIEEHVAIPQLGPVGGPLERYQDRSQANLPLQPKPTDVKCLHLKPSTVLKGCFYITPTDVTPFGFYARINQGFNNFQLIHADRVDRRGVRKAISHSLHLSKYALERFEIGVGFELARYGQQQVHSFLVFYPRDESFMNDVGDLGNALFEELPCDVIHEFLQMVKCAEKLQRECSYFTIASNGICWHRGELIGRNPVWSLFRTDLPPELAYG